MKQNPRQKNFHFEIKENVFISQVCNKGEFRYKEK